MNRFSKCKNNRKGFTLIEILATLIILVLLVVAIGSIMTSAMKVYDESIFESDAAVLSNILDSSLGDLLRYARSVTTGSATKAPYIVDGSSSPVLIVGENVYSLEDNGFYFTNLDYGVKNGYLSLTEDGYVAINSPLWDESQKDQLLVNEGSYAGDILVKSMQVKYYPVGVEVDTEAEDITPDDGSGDGGYFIVDYIIAAGPEDDAPQIERSVCVRLMNAEVSSTASSGERVPVDRGSHEDYSGASEHVVNYHAHKEGDGWDDAKMVIRAGEYSDMVSDNVSGRVVTLFGQDSAVLDGMVLRAWVDKSGNEYKPGASYDFTNKIINLYGSWEKEPQQLTVNLKNGAELTLTYKDVSGASVTKTLTSSERLEIPLDTVVYYSFNNYDLDAHSGCEPKVTLIKRGHAETSLSRIAVSGDFTMGEGSYTLNAAVPYLVTWSLDGTDAAWVENGGKTLVTPFYDQAVAIPAINYQGHDVASWTASPETLLAPARGDRSYYASGDVTLTPTFEVNTVRFNGNPTDADAGHDAELASFTYDELTYYYTPSIEGWTFLGWYNAGGKLYSDLASIKTALESGSLDLYAHYVKFDSSSALSATDAWVSLGEKSVTLLYPEVSVAPNAYFLGWYTEDNTFIGYDRPYNDDPTFWSWRVILSARTVTLEKVTDAEDEVIHYSEGTVNRNSGTLFLPSADYTATDAKYYFLGWYDLEDYGNFWGAAEKGITTEKNLTLYPRWLKITTSAVDTRGNLLDFTSAEVTLSADGSFVISVSPVIYDGYTFKGWYRVEGENRTLMGTAVNSPLTARSAVTVYDAALVEDTAYFTYASMDRNAGLLGYYVGDEEMADPRITVAVGAVSGEAPLITAKPLPNYKFDRWERIQNGELVAAYNTEGLQITRQNGEVFKDTTFNAYFVLNSCPLTIHADHATIVEQGTENSWSNEAAVEVSVGTNLTTSVDFGGISISNGSGYLIKPDFGYTLAGWQVEYDHYVLGASGLEVTAIVKPATYNVTYVGLDPMESEAETAGTYTYGTDVQLQIPEDPDWEFEGWVVQKAQSVKGVDWDDEHDPLWENVGTEENPLTAAPKDPDGYTYGNVKLKAKWSEKTVDLQVDLSETWVLINLQESSVTVTYPDSTTKDFKVSDASFILSGISSGASAEYSSDLKTVTITANNGIWKIEAHPGRYGIAGLERSVNVDFAQALSGGAIRGENPIVKIDFNRGFDEEIPAITFDAGNGGSISGYDPNGRSFSGRKTFEFDHGTELTVYKDRITYDVRNYSSVTTRTITAKPSNHYQNDGWSIVDAGGVVTKITADKYIVNQSVTIRADFIGVDCPVTVKAGLGGTVNEEKQISFTAHYGDAVLADSDSLAIGSETVLAKADRGYHFSGWGNLPETVTGSLEITASFAGNTAIFDANGGAFADSSLQQQLTYAGSPLTPEQPARPGFLFVNWYKDASGQISAGDMVPETDGAIYYAKWDQQTYLVTLEKEGPGNLDHYEIRIPSNSRVTQSTNNLNLIYFTNSSTGLNSEQVSASVTEDGYHFDHWVFDANGASEVMEPGVAKTIEKSPTAIKAVFTGYQITLDAKGGHFESDDVTTKTLLYSAYNWEHLPEPTRSGYRFVGWLTEDGKEPSIPSSDITLVAAWETLKYSVTIDAVTNGVPDETGKGGTAQTEDGLVRLQAYSENVMAVDQTAGTVTISVKAPADAEAEDVLIKAEAKDGYHFVSWTVSDNEDSTTKVLNNLTLTANFAGNKVIYDAGEGVFEDGNHTFEEVYDGALTEPVPSLEGSTFLGWFVDATTPVSTDPIPHSETTTYTAHWDVASYSLSVTAEGSGSIGDYPSVLSYESEISASGAVLTVTDKATVATKTVTATPDDGFYFNGWTLNNESWDGEKHTVREDVSIVASFEGYEVTFDAGEGAFADGSSEKTETFGKLSWETPARPGYKFNGWYLADQEVNPETYAPKGNETLAADWTGYTVIYDPNGGMINGSTETTSEVFSGALHLPTPTMLGHKFEGWFTAAEGGNVVREYTVPADNVTYYAQWSDESYTISYYSNGSPVTPQGATTAYHYGDSVILTKLQDYGEFTFLGWKLADSTGNNWNTEMITASSVGDVYGNVRLDAVWQEAEYTITYLAEGLEAQYENYFASTTGLKIAAAPSISDKYFLGWEVTDADDASWTVGKVFSANDTISSKVRGNVTLTAKLTAAEKTVTVSTSGYTATYSIKKGNETLSSPFKVPTGSVVTVDGTVITFTYPDAITKVVVTGSAALENVAPPEWSGNIPSNGELVLEDISMTVSARFLGQSVKISFEVSKDASGNSMGYVAPSELYCPTALRDRTARYSTADNVLTATSDAGLFSGGTVRQTAKAMPENGYYFVGWNPASNSSTNDMKVSVIFAGYKASFNPNSGIFADGTTATKTEEYQGTAIVFPEISRGNDTFEGWRKVGTTEKPKKSGSFIPSEDVSYEAVWTPKDYELIYQDENRNDLGNKENYQFTDTLTLRSYEKDFYTLDSWIVSAMDASGNNWNASYKPGVTVGPGLYGNVFLIENWKADTYTLTYELNGGTASGTYTPAGDYSVETSVQLPHVTKEGYIFNGWTVAVQGDGNWETSYDGSTLNLGKGFYGNVTLTANWTPVTYTVTYNGNDEEGGSTAAGTHTYDVEKALTANGFYKTGYAFQGWATDPAADVSYADKQVVKNLSKVQDANVTLYAKWALANYTITYNFDNGEPVGAYTTGTYTINDAFVLPKVTKVGNTFKGWTVSVEDGGKWEKSYDESGLNLGKGYYGNVTLTAEWEPIKYNIEFSAEGGSGSMSGIYNVKYGDEVTLPANAFERKGYAFAGWTTDNGGLYDDGAKVSNLSAIPTTVVLRAKWVNAPYTITYEGAEGSPASYRYGQEFNLSIPSASSKPGYTFKKWTVKETNGNWEHHEFTQASPKVSVGMYGDVTLLAEWDPISYTISFDSDGGSIEGVLSSYKINESFTLPDAKKQGYTFIGWDVTKNDGGVWTRTQGLTGEMEAGQYGNVTLKARWSVNSYKVIIKTENSVDVEGLNVLRGKITTNDGTGLYNYNRAQDSYEIELPYGAEISVNNSNRFIRLAGDSQKTYYAIPNPSAGCEFEAWSSSNGNLSSVTGDVVITATFKWTPYSISTTNEDGNSVTVSKTAAHYGEIIKMSVKFTHQGKDALSVKPNLLSSLTIYSDSACTQTANVASSAGNYEYYFRMPADDVAVRAYNTSGCFAAGTMITLADGSQRPIEEISPNEYVLVFNHETGRLDTARMGLIVHEGQASSMYRVMTLLFEDGREVRVINHHGFFDSTENCYIYISGDNYSEYIGHEFFVADSGNGVYQSKKVKLVGVRFSNEMTCAFAPITEYHLNCFANGVLSMTSSMDGLFNIFELDSSMKYDEVKMKADIEKYGLFSYEDFEDYIPYEVYRYFPAEYFKVSIGKGNLTFDHILELVEKFTVTESIQKHGAGQISANETVPAEVPIQISTVEKIVPQKLKTVIDWFSKLFK